MLPAQCSTQNKSVVTHSCVCAERRGLQGVQAVLEAAQHAAPSGQVMDAEGAGRRRRLMELSVLIQRHQALALPGVLQRSGLRLRPASRQGILFTCSCHILQKVICKFCGCPWWDERGLSQRIIAFKRTAAGVYVMMLAMLCGMHMLNK